MASKIKVDTLETADGSGSIALSNQFSGMTTASLPTTGTLPALDGSNLTGVSGGKVVKMTLMLATSQVITTTSTFIDAHSQAHTMQSSSNILVFLGTGSINRAGIDGGLQHRLYNATTSTEVRQARYHGVKDNDIFPILTTHISGYSGSVTFKLQFNSSTNNSKAGIDAGTGWILLEIDNS